MSVYEDEHLVKDIQLPEIWMAFSRGGSYDSGKGCETYRENAGVELITPAFFMCELLRISYHP